MYTHELRCITIIYILLMHRVKYHFLWQVITHLDFAVQRIYDI